MQQNCPGIDELSRWLADTPPASKRGELEAHVETCAHCQSAVENLLGPRAAKRDASGESSGRHAEAEFLQRVAMQEPSAFQAVTAAAPLLAPLAQVPLPVIKGYEILEEIGRGGMGIVYKAWQRELNRLVAIKMVLLGAAATPETLVRFRQEAELAARLQHPNIVQVHEIIHQEQSAFLIMEFVEGGSLSRQCHGRPQPAEEAARLVEVLARAIEHAHRKGVLHRDLKPGNVLLTAEGFPKIADFGLATCIGLDSGLTATGAVLGTPGYMAPEQASQHDRQAGPATDVYGLGAILYELLTGRPPVTGSDLMDVLLRLRQEEAIPPRRLQPSVPRDLETVCLKCLQKDPRHRYASAEALADDLRRFLDGKPIAARPVSMPERAWRWAKRNRAEAATLGAVAVLLVVLALGSTIAAVLFRAERNRAVEAEGRAETARRDTQDLLAKGLRSVAGEVRAMRLRGEQGAYSRGMRKLRDALALARELDAREDVIRALRDEMGNVLTVADIEITREWDGYPAETNWLVFAPNLDRYARGTTDGTVTVHETGTGKELSRLPIPAALPYHFACFSPDGQLLVFATGNKTVICWDVDAPQATRRWEYPGHRVFLSPDGHLALYSRIEPANTTQIVEARSGKEVRRLTQGTLFNFHPVHPGRPWVALSDGKDLIAVDYQTGKQVGQVPSPRATNVCWHPSSPVMAAACDFGDHRVCLWDVTTGLPVVPPLLGHSHPGVNPVFDRSGRYLLTTEWSDIIRVWDGATGRLMFQTPLPPANGNMFVGCDGESAGAVHGQKLQLFRVYPGEGLRIVPPTGEVSAGFTEQFAADPSGRVVAIGKIGTGTVLLDARNGRQLGVLPGESWVVASSGADGSLLTAGDRGPERWPVRVAGDTCQVGPAERIDMPRFNSRKLGMSADGRVIAVPDYDHGAFVWDRERAGGVLRTEPQRDVRNVAISPDGRWVVAGSHWPGTVSVYDARTGKVVRYLMQEGGIPVYSPGGRWVGVWASRGGATLFRAGTWERVRPLGDGRGAFAPDDRLVAFGEGYGGIRLVGTETGQDVCRLETTDQTRLLPLGFSPDGGRLYALGEQNRTLYIWDLRLIRARLKAMGADWDWDEFAPPLPNPPDDAPPVVRIVAR
jgi:WD40 repeat protein